MPGSNRGRRGRRWARLKAEVRARRGKCCRCGQPIKYELEWPDPGSFSVDHFPHPLSTHPHLAEDPAALAPSHLRCNQSASDNSPRPGLGVLSQDY